MLDQHLRCVRVLALHLRDSYVDFCGCTMVAAALSVAHQGQEEGVAATMLEERTILVSFLLAIREEASSPKPLWFISALASTVFPWLP